MVTKSFLLATALATGTMAQTTSVMDLLLDTAEDTNATFVGSVISAVPEATTYAVSRLPDADCPWTPREECGDGADLSRIYVNGPSTFARHFTEPDAFTWDTECNISGESADCEMTVAGPSAVYEFEETQVFEWRSSHVNPVTITAGLEKLQAVSTTTSGTAQTAASASSGPSETGASASATSSSSSASTPETTASTSAANGAVRNVALAAFCGVVVLVLGM